MIKPTPEEFQRLKRESIDWLVRLNSGEASPAELEQFREWLKTTPGADKVFERVGRAWGLMGEAHRLAEDTASPPKPEPIKRSVRPIRRFGWGRAVAALAACFLLFVLLQSNPPSLWTADYRTGTGEQATVSLQDGSRVQLNTQTALDVEYSASSRRLKMRQGEVFFEVAKDPARPFIVQVEGHEIQAVGTAFNIYQMEAGVRLSVTEGIVRLTPATQNAPVELEAGEGIFIKPGGLGPVKNFDSTTPIAWLKKQIVFNSTPLGDVVAEINRYRDGKIFIWDSSLASLKVSGTFHLQNPDEILDAITRAFAIQSTSVLGRYTVLYAG